MARSQRRSGRSRGRNRGSLYARPIPEPCNFLEFNIVLNESDFRISHQDIFTALTGIIPAASISKYRVSSIVIEPIQSAQSLVTGQAQFGISGNEYLFTSSNRPLKIRIGKEYGDDGMWIVTDGLAISDGALPGNETTTDSFLSLINVLAPSWSTTAHVRLAWQDPL